MKTQQGFTLIELMIVVGIIGILAAIAIPAYQDSVLKSRREDAKSVLLGLANAMERHFTLTNSYCDAANNGGVAVAGCGAGTEDTGPAAIFATPAETARFYTITISAVTATVYTLSAVPTGAQTGDGCGTLSVTQTGAKAATGALANCW
ncbi:MAG: prepilin-type N-terminal cleavage/methylation domain-containing protein [Methylomonas sp.]|nr:prepilin-type N-terminal cleavage/methylation domain-containing protein [Methylomonas sp.]PPD20989.1 MAG: pilus assembly protein PilE [Methylomonas sp.]PPD27234.1 MAG: pilus assembly protein PilE [Methylomonas sp.]PPD39184.1 MAG: pilus assembly protein PilE [Methylomonas sp.]PPD41344.1 MAG: pilus assembly protein PilE [Methylomonas sp.]